MYRGNFKSPQKILKFIVAILKRSVFGVYLFNSHAQTIALISSTLIFQSFFELLLKLPLQKNYLLCTKRRLIFYYTPPCIPGAGYDPVRYYAGA